MLNLSPMWMIEYMEQWTTCKHPSSTLRSNGALPDTSDTLLHFQNS